MSMATTMVHGGNDRLHHNAGASAQEGDAQTGDEPLLPTFYCRALYDYQSSDNSSLSFFRGDIIEVLTQLESGWWDGLIGEERGWFPSNYVQPISESEAEAELGSQYDTRAGEGNDAAPGTRLRVMGSGLESDQEWLQEELEYEQSRAGLSNGGTHSEDTANNQDFWLPQVDVSGQIFYVNTLTGERSRDLPTELGGATNVDNDFTDLTQGRGIRGANQRSNNFVDTSRAAASSSHAGFGVSKRSGTPEPWTKRLADDGLTYYYFNKITGQIQWTRPTIESSQASDLSTTVPRIDTTSTVVYPSEQQNGQRIVAGPSSTTSGYASTDTMLTEARLRADSVTSNNQSSTKRDSVYSDDSDIHPRDASGQQRPSRTVTATGLEEEPGLTPAERAAMLLQEALAPPSPETIDALSDLTREAIIVVMASVDDNGLPKGVDHDKEVEQNVTSVVIAVRNLLYVSCALSGPLPNADDELGNASATAVAQQLQAQLKTSQRKVTATLSKLVLSARAARYRRETFTPEMMIRIEQDAADLQRAVDNFVSEAKKQYSRTVIKQLHQRVGRKRLRGVFDLKHVGSGLPGAGVGGSWKGFGFINVDEGLGLPKRTLNEDAISEARHLQRMLDDSLSSLVELLQVADTAEDELFLQAQVAMTDLSAFISFLVDVNVCQEVDVGGLLGEPPNMATSEDPYLQAVCRAKALLRNMEAITQGLYDDGTTFFVFAQNIPFEWPKTGTAADTIGRQPLFTSLYSSSKVLRSDSLAAVDYLGKLLGISLEQIASEDRFRESMAVRISRMSIINGNRRLSQFFGPLPETNNDEEDVVDMDFAFSKPPRTNLVALDELQPAATLTEEAHRQSLEETPLTLDTESVQPPGHKQSFSISGGQIHLQEPPEDDDFVEKGPLETRATKIRQLLGEDAPERYIENANADKKPWYLRTDHNKDEIVLNPDGGIRAGTMSALVERLTTHEYSDPVFIRTFLMTYKSFTTVNELFELLVHRYWIQPPDGLKPAELEEWTKLKQHVIRSRVLNTFKTMIMDDQVLVDDDLYILDRIQEFLRHPDVAISPASKNLQNIIERKRQGGLKPLTLTPPTSFPPPSIIPKGMNKGRLKILDIDPLELARQLTIMEFSLYRKIKAIECLQRSREQKVGEHKDHITDVIHMTNKIANWVNATVLNKEDSRKRAALVKQFIAVAERCRNLHNFSSMAAIISGLNSPPIRRLKRTWEQVSGKYMSQLGICEMTLDSTKNFTNYKATLANTNPPGIPFIGVYLTTLTFINDGSKDVLPGNLVNFGKRQRAAEIIREIQHWQSKDFNIAPLQPIMAFIEEALSSFSDSVDWGEQFWNLSLEREPREREDERMARLLQESGFL